MRKVLLFFLIVMMTVSSCNCGCENRMNAVTIITRSMKYMAPLPVDLPNTKEYIERRESLVEIGVTPEGKYFTNKDSDKLLSFEQLQTIMSDEAQNNPGGNIKISGDKSANYESILQLIALCKELELKPILAYKKG